MSRLGRHCKVFGHRVNLDEVEDVARTDQPAAALENEGVIIVVFEGDGGVEAQSVMRLARRFGLPPQVFRFQGVTRLPRTANGKICYRTLQSML